MIRIIIVITYMAILRLFSYYVDHELVKAKKCEWKDIEKTCAISFLLGFLCCFTVYFFKII